MFLKKFEMMSRAMRTHRKPHKKNFAIRHQDPLKRIWPMGGSFWAPGPPKLTLVESKRCQFLFILSMGQDGVFKKNPDFTHLENEQFFWDTL